jgi:hypothetical protein
MDPNTPSRGLTLSETRSVPPRPARLVVRPRSALLHRPKPVHRAYLHCAWRTDAVDYKMKALIALALVALLANGAVADNGAQRWRGCMHGPPARQLCPEKFTALGGPHQGGLADVRDRIRPPCAPVLNGSPVRQKRASTARPCSLRRRRRSAWFVGPLCSP